MNTLFERLGIHLPQYHNAKVDRFLIRTKPNYFWQKWIPYFVGNKVSFMIRIEDTEQRADSSPMRVFEIFGDSEHQIKKIERVDLTNEWLTLTGNPIDREGDVIYSFGLSAKSAISSVIFSAHVINKDRWLLGCGGLVIGAILTIITTIISGIVLGFIKIEPILKMFITP
jgi:hypothetical protein